MDVAWLHYPGLVAVRTIANNVGSKIIRQRLNDPAFYDSMSALLTEIIAMMDRFVPKWHL